MCISDWSSDVCSSDLINDGFPYLPFQSPNKDRLFRALQTKIKMLAARNRVDLFQYGSGQPEQVDLLQALARLERTIVPSPRQRQHLVGCAYRPVQALTHGQQQIGRANV